MPFPIGSTLEPIESDRNSVSVSATAENN